MCGVIETTEIDGYPALRLDGGDGLTAAFAPTAGMVGVSLRDGDDELLGQRHGIAGYAREARTMGIPLLHPWANRLDRDEISVAGGTITLRDGAVGLHRDPNGLAIHGLLAGLPEWTVTEQEGAAFSATFDFGAHPELLATFPSRTSSASTSRSTAARCGSPAR